MMLRVMDVSSCFDDAFCAYVRANRVVVRVEVRANGNFVDWMRENIYIDEIIVLLVCNAEINDTENSFVL